jgi:hypothetical protein
MTKTTQRQAIKELRALVPTRPMTLSESYTKAEQQATASLRLIGITHPSIDLGWIFELPKVDVQLRPRYRMDGLSGVTTFTGGRYLVLVNKNDSHARRRFTLAHELKHVIDYTAAPVIHRHLGYGDPDRQSAQIEAICNHFAACLLMPRNWVKIAWLRGLQDVTSLSGLFGVSEEAMEHRLNFLGYIDRNPRPARTYFRRSHLALAV